MTSNRSTSNTSTSNTPIALPVASRRMSVWRFWLPLTAQALLILAIPAQAVYTHIAGKTVVLQTGPVDPFDMLRGYYVTLGYDISNPNELKTLPGWEAIAKTADVKVTDDPASPPSPSLFAPGQEFYVVLQAPQQKAAQPPLPWQPVRVSDSLPTNLAPNQVALRGVYRLDGITYGLETYYIPEEQRVDINNRINQLNSTQGSPPFVVEAKVDPTGHAVPLGLWVKDQHYQF